MLPFLCLCGLLAVITYVGLRQYRPVVSDVSCNIFRTSISQHVADLGLSE